MSASATLHASWPDGTYDTLDVYEQAVVRAEWDEQMTAVRQGLDFTAELSDSGESWVEADEQGCTVHRQSADAGAEQSGPTAKKGAASST